MKSNKIFTHSDVTASDRNLFIDQSAMFFYCIAPVWSWLLQVDYIDKGDLIKNSGEKIAKFVQCLHMLELKMLNLH